MTENTIPEIPADDEFDRLLEQSSIGSPEARAVSDRVAAERAEDLVRRLVGEDDNLDEELDEISIERMDNEFDDDIVDDEHANVTAGDDVSENDAVIVLSGLLGVVSVGEELNSEPAVATAADSRLPDDRVAVLMESFFDRDDAAILQTCDDRQPLPATPVASAECVASAQASDEEGRAKKTRQRLERLREIQRRRKEILLRREILAALIDIVKETTGIAIDSDGLSPDATFADLGIDSMAGVEITKAIETRYDISISVDDWAELRTVNDVVSFCLQRLSDEPPAATEREIAAGAVCPEAAPRREYC